ncbi:MAG: hypothetical protein OXS47_08825 [Chloroflexota bacterium]|nr:hypothetical protein [Chloroflexota bacterium]
MSEYWCLPPCPIGELGGDVIVYQIEEHFADCPPFIPYELWRAAETYSELCRGHCPEIVVAVA